MGSAQSSGNGNGSGNRNNQIATIPEEIRDLQVHHCVCTHAIMGTETETGTGTVQSSGNEIGNGDGDGDCTK